MNSLISISLEEYIEIRTEEAVEEAVEKANRETARRLKTMRLPLAQIAEGVGLSPEEIEKL